MESTQLDKIKNLHAEIHSGGVTETDSKTRKFRLRFVLGVQLYAGLSPSGRGIALSRRGKNITQNTHIANATVFGGKVKPL